MYCQGVFDNHYDEAADQFSSKINIQIEDDII